MKHRLNRPVSLKPALPLLLALVAIRFAVGGGTLIESDPAATGVDRLAYAQFMAYRVADPYELESFFTDQQDFFLPINPPYADFTLNQPGFPSAIPFDPSSFPPDFTKNLLPRLENSVPVYGVWIEEDPVTRDTVFRNEQDQVIYRIPPPPGYDPYVYIKALKPDLYSGRYPSLQLQSLLAIFDPARIRIHVTLVPEKQVESYLYTASILASQVELPVDQMLMMEGGSDDLAFVSMRLTNSIAFSIVLPLDLTNSVDVYTSTDLLGAWNFAVKDLAYPGTNVLQWIDSNDWLEVGHPFRYYAVGDAETDSDGDGYADAREVMVYQTDPANSNSRPSTVCGEVIYSGLETGPVVVVFVTEHDCWSTAKSSLLPGPGGFTNSEVGNDIGYWIKAFMDVNGNRAHDAWEPNGQYDASAVVFTQDTSGIMITMADEPSAWGAVSYTGRATGDIIVVVSTTTNGWDMTNHTVIPWVKGVDQTGGVLFVELPADYALVGMTTGVYWIKAFIDADGSGTYTFGDVYGVAGTNAVVLTNRTTGIDIDLVDRDTDADGMPDWWEMYHGLNPVDPEDSEADGDGDSISNGEEYQANSDPGTREFVGVKKAKILVGESGIYRVTKSSLASVLNCSESDIATNTLRLSVQGTAVPSMRDDGDLIFFGEHYEDLYTDKNAYIVHVGPAIEVPVVEVEDSEQEPMNSWATTMRVESNATYGGVFVEKSDIDPIFWRTLVSGSLPIYLRVTNTFSLIGVSANNENSINVSVNGQSSGVGMRSHRATIYLNGSSIGTIDFDGTANTNKHFVVPAGVLNPGNNIFQIDNTPPSGTTSDSFYLDYFELTYRRAYPTTVVHEVIVPDTGTIRIDTESVEDIHIWDVSDGLHPSSLTGFVQATNSFEFIRFSNGCDRLVLWRDGGARTNALLMPLGDVSLLDPTNRADYLMIVGAGLEEQAQVLADYRASSGFRVCVVSIESAFDAITQGRRSGIAIKQLVNSMLRIWSQPPTYVLLVGDGSMDYRNKLGDNDSIIPTEPVLRTKFNPGENNSGIYNSDHSVMDCDADGFMDFAVGRIPAQSTADLGAAITNIMVYELGGGWRSNTLIATDYTDNAGNYFAEGNDLQSRISNKTQVVRADLSVFGSVEAHSRTTNYLAVGVGMFIYIGHGYETQFSSSGLLVMNDVNTMTNRGMPSVYLAMACQSGAFGSPKKKVICEAIVLRPGVGSSALAAATYITLGDAQVFSETMFSTMYEVGLARVGDCFKAGKNDLIQTFRQGAAWAYQLLGDPALLIQGGGP